MITSEEWKIWYSLWQKPNFEIKSIEMAQELSEELLQDFKSRTTTRRIKFLVDGYGLFKGSKEFWKAKVETDNPEAMLRISYGALLGVRDFFCDQQRCFRKDTLWAGELLILCYILDNEPQKIKERLGQYKAISELEFSFTYFYAPVSERQKSAITDSLRKLAEINSLPSKMEYLTGWRESTLQYEKFQKELPTSQFLKGDRSEGVGRIRSDNGIFRTISEKEVDAKIVIAAMDALHEQTCDDLVIVSNDTDFLALEKRFFSSDVKYHQFPLGHFLQGQNPSWDIKVNENFEKAKYLSDKNLFARLLYDHHQSVDDMQREKYINFDPVYESEEYHKELYKFTMLSSEEYEKVHRYENLS